MTSNIVTDNTLTSNQFQLTRPNRFSALAETSFKSPMDLGYSGSMLSKSPKEGSKRRIDHSPVSVNTTYELSEKNTSKLWANF